MQRVSFFSQRIVEAGWLILAVGLPLFFAPWGRNTFELPKVLLSWATVALMGAAWLYGFRVKPGRDLPAAPGAMALTVAVALILSTIFSLNPLLSIQGSYDRMQGAITQLCYLALFLIITTQMRRLAQVRSLLAAISWGSAPVVVYGFLQILGLDPMGWRVEGVRVISFLGRSNFLGAYLVLVFPFTIANIWLKQDRSWRIAYAILLGAQVVCLVATMARAAWLGALVAGGVLVLAGAWQRGYRRIVAASVIVGALGLLVGMLALLTLPSLTGSIGARTTIWRATWLLIAARPILGYGPGTFGHAFTAVFPPELVYLQGRAVLVDHAHNLFLDTLASVGCLGLLAYVALVGTALVTGMRRLAQSQDSEVRVIITTGLAAAVGHLVETQLSFQVTATAALFWLMLGMLVAPWDSHPSATVPTTNALPWVRRVLAAALLLTLVPASLACLAADAYAGNANRASTPGDLQNSVAAAQRAVTLWPNQSTYHQHLSWLYFQLAEFRSAEEALDAARRLTPDDYRVWAGYGELYTEWGRAADPNRFVQAEDAYRQAVALFPGSAMLHTAWGLLYVAQGRLADAEAQFHQAVNMDHTDATAFRYLGDVQLAQGDLAGAKQAYVNALRWSPNMAEAYRGLGHVYRQTGSLELALSAYQSVLSLTPGDPDAYLYVAQCAWELGRRDLACQTGERGLLLAPEHPALLELRAVCAR